jgi:8-oxo-dGTP pyrophosphatase MutT (NUDIX family)
MQYQNPIPVAVAIVPVRAVNPATGLRQIGLLTIERGVPPQVGALALPGGYLEYEDWRAGLLRELREETGVSIEDEHAVTLEGAFSIDSNRKIVLFGSVPPIDEWQLANFSSNSECPRFQIIFEAQELAFQTHSAMARRFFENQRACGSPWLDSPGLPGGFRCSER